MADTGLYKIITASDADMVFEPGYFKAWISLVTDFTTLQEPAPGMTPVAGDNYKIAVAHVWAEDAGAVPVLVDEDTIDIPGESAGEVGTQRIVWRPKIFMLGDSPASLEMANNWLNQKMILFVQQECGTNEYLQFGCDCYPARMEKETFSGGQILSGKKGYEFTLRAICKYFYTGTITELP
jgi:hypothetical protein